MPPPTLDEHVFAEILLNCDIHHVLKFTRVDKWCRSAALSKQLWLSLIRDLEFRGLHDANPKERLEDGTTQDLIAKVKRIASGPRTWLPSSLMPPTLEREVLVNLGPQYDAACTVVQLLPGGQYFLVCRLPSASVSSIWSVSSQKCIWSRQQTVAGQLELSAVDLIEGGERVVVAFVVRAQHPFIECIEVNLRTGNSSVIFERPIPRRFGVVTQCKVLGDYLALIIHAKVSSEIHILNWVQATCVCLQFPGAKTCEITCSLLPGRIAVVHPNDSRERVLCASVYSLRRLYWIPLVSWNLILPDTRRPSSSLILVGAELDLISVDLTTRRAVCRPDAYEFGLELLMRKPPISISGFISKLWLKMRPTWNGLWRAHYSFILPPPSGCTATLEPSIVRRSSMRRPFYGVAIAQDGRVIVYDRSDGFREIFQINHPLINPKSPQLGTYSAALPLVKDSVLRIMYFE
ncbi:hypothetical protein FB45DRAFT_933177 [Roridomyces roridus]|uniref:F-box domain-containing protein n=1 Tax=Roridomyces roridus TaxID=1738132 RepID=A0AAD7BDL6_9AGAR|nr:hypothetical protein FB45DRAFT_933177 [Roridomyces roridus]